MARAPPPQNRLGESTTALDIGVLGVDLSDCTADVMCGPRFPLLDRWSTCWSAASTKTARRRGGTDATSPPSVSQADISLSPTPTIAEPIYLYLLDAFPYIL